MVVSSIGAGVLERWFGLLCFRVKEGKYIPIRALPSSETDFTFDSSMCVCMTLNYGMEV